MRLGSHNTMTFAPVKPWYLKPFKFMAQCQSKNIRQQYDAGARFFDLRIAFDEFGTPEFAHGLITFKYDTTKALEELNSLPTPVYVRLINERDKNYEDFIKFCIISSILYKNIVFVGGLNKKDWRILYNFEHREPTYIDKYSSNNHDKCDGYNEFNETKHVDFSGGLWDDLFPRYYAWKNNKKWREFFLDKTERDFLLQDFVGVY